MPWTKGDYPPSMKNLDERVRDKAVEIANALLKDGYEEGRAIAIATAQAKEWDDNHPKSERKSDDRGSRSDGSRSESDSGKDRSSGSDRRSVGRSDILHVVPHDNGWAVKEEGNEDVRFSADTKEEAVDQAKKWASEANTTAIIHGRDGKIDTTHNYT